jgi:hypothetical protein
MPYKIIAEKDYGTISTERNSLIISIAGARVLASQGCFWAGNDA